MAIIERLTLLALSGALGGCAVIGEIAYDNKVERERESCRRLPDQSSYANCMARVRAIEMEADKSRKAP